MLSTKVISAASALVGHLLRDDFTNDVAAGSVNSTSAVPGPGTRIVVDAYNTVENISNPGFETAGAGGADVFSGWVEDATNGTIARTTTSGEYRSGSAGLKITASADNSVASVYHSINAIPGQTYRFTFWTKGDGTNAGRYRVYNSSLATDIVALTSTGITGSTFTQVSVDVTAAPGTSFIRFYLYSGAVNGSIACFDDVSVMATSYQDAISGSQFSLVGNANWEKSKFNYQSSITRLAGRTLRVDINNVNSVLGFVGFSTGVSAFSGHNNVGIAIDTSQNITARKSSGANSINLFTTTTNTLYPTWTVLRNSGRYIFIKGTDNQLRLWHVDEWDSTGTLYVGATVNTLNKTLTLDNIRIPKAFYIVQSLASDSFNRADGSLGNTDGAGHAEANSGSGKSWSNQIGSFSIVNNTAKANSLAGGIAISTVDANNINVYLRVKVTRAGGSVGVIIRYLDSNNYIYAVHDGTNAKLVKRVGGTETNVIGPTAATYTASAYLTVSADGTTFYLDYNELRIGSGTINDAGLQSSTLHGLYTTDTGNSHDNFVVFARRGYSDLEAM